MSRFESDQFCTKGTMAAILHDCRFAGGISASGQSAGFGGNLFTRDTLRVVRDVIGLRGYGSFVREILGVLPQWQGIEEDPSTNELPDALPHQVFRQVVGGRRLPDSQMETAEYWTGKWGVEMKSHPDNGRQFVLYNSSDGPLLYLIALSEFCRVAGYGVLRDTFRHWPTGTDRTVGEAARRCVDYIVGAVGRSEDAGLGLYGVPNANPKQTSPSGVMRDGFDAYVRPDGRAAEYAFAAYCENQALVYEALVVAACELFPEDAQAKYWLSLADELRRRTIDRLWTGSFFAAAIDTHGPIETASSAVFEMLDGPFFDGLADGPEYVKAIVTRLYQPDFMTAIGPRMVSLEHSGLEGDYYAYQGSGAVWGVTNGIVATSLHRWSLGDVARDMGHGRLIGWFNRARQAMELTYVHRESGQPLYESTAQDGRSPAGYRKIYPAELGQPDQAWSASAALRQLHTDYKVAAPQPGTWQFALNQQVMQLAREIPTAQSANPSDPLYVDLVVGRELKRRRAESLGISA